MPKKAIFVRISDGQNERSFDAIALDKNNSLTFQDDEHAWHTVTLGANHIHYLKQGEISVTLTFQEAHYHPAEITVSGKTLTLLVYTESLRQTAESLIIHYSLWDEEERLSQHQFTLMFKEGASHDIRT